MWGMNLKAPNQELCGALTESARQPQSSWLFNTLFFCCWNKQAQDYIFLHGQQSKEKITENSGTTFPHPLLKDGNTYVITAVFSKY